MQASELQGYLRAPFTRRREGAFGEVAEFRTGCIARDAIPPIGCVVEEQRKPHACVHRGEGHSRIYQRKPRLRDRWIALMDRAFAEAELLPEAERFLRQFFGEMATFLINQEG